MHVPPLGTDSGLSVHTPATELQRSVLTPEALDLVADLCRRFRPRLEELLQARRARQARWDAGEPLDFLPETREVREADWKVAPLPCDLMDRRVEITGPVDRKMIVNALNSGAQVFMADFEDANSPTWENVVSGQAWVREAAAGTLGFDDPATGKAYRLSPQPAVLMVRPRGWHLPERHLTVDGVPAPAALVDFGLFAYHAARVLVERGSGPYVYLPKIESHLEARLWNDVFLHVEGRLRLPAGTVKATVLIETLPAAFEMDEILWELREHAAGLNCGRWDYIFSAIKTRREDPAAVMPDRAQVTMEQPFLRAYTQLLVKTCHRRGAFAMGGMAAQIPIKNDPEAGRVALDKVRADKRREVSDGHDGTWVAHPGLVAVAREVFDAAMSGTNQLGRLRQDVRARAEDLLRVPQGTRTAEGLRWNLRVGIQYLEAWLRGVGCVPLYHLMEDAATAEICRVQVWQWLRHGARLDDGRAVTPAMVREVLAAETAAVEAEGAVPDSGRLAEASALFGSLVTSETLPDFLTLPAYDLLLSLEGAAGGTAPSR